MNLSLFGYPNLLDEIKQKNDEKAIELLQKIDQMSFYDEDIVDKMLDIHKDIKEIKDEDIRNKFLEIFNKILSHLSWFDALSIKVFLSQDEKAKEIIRYMREIDGKENKENVERLEEMIDYYDDNQEIRIKLLKKLKQFKKRVERAIPEDFGLLVKHARQDKGLSLQELSELTGISTSYIHRIEKGDRKSPSYPLMEKIAKVLEIDLSKILKVNKSGEKLVSSFSELILGNNFTVNGKLVSRKQKEYIINIVEKIVNTKWKEDRTKKMVEIIDLIDKLNEE